MRGQRSARRAVEIAAAGRHNLLLVGPPGAGKTLLARRLPGILPRPTFDEAIAATAIHSVAGLLEPSAGLLAERPFRAPHHSASDAALIGGGRDPRPGEVSLAHNGVLFLDEIVEFDRRALEALREPLEDGVVRIARALRTVQFPSRFLLVGAMNPCACGYAGEALDRCRCSVNDVARYHDRLSGPLRDRIDLTVRVERVSFQVLAGDAPAEDSATVRERVRRARDRQAARYHGETCGTNADLAGSGLRDHGRLDAESLTPGRARHAAVRTHRARVRPHPPRGAHHRRSGRLSAHPEVACCRSDPVPRATLDASGTEHPRTRQAA